MFFMNRTLSAAALVLGSCLTFGGPGLGLSFAATVPRPEHPRPDVFRENWATLNGDWQFEIDEQGNGEARGLISGTDLGSKIVVPFCPESKLSGIGHYGLMKNTWYR